MFAEIAAEEHEAVHLLRDNEVGLSAIVAIHSTTRGPAGGGCRVWRYESDQAALVDALRLSRGMSYKNALAGLDLGGGKAVIALPAGGQLTEAMLDRFGQFVESLDGKYVTAEDVGMSEGAMQVVARHTRYVTGLPQQGAEAGGDPSPKTAFGVFCGIKAALNFRFGNESIAGKRVAVQGVGNVGYHLCRLLSEAGAQLVVADIDPHRTERAAQAFNAQVVGLDDILYQSVDVLAPCALGAVFHADNIGRLQTPIIAGGANNQLREDADGQRLADRDIVYAPDYVINAGGIISCAREYQGQIGQPIVSSEEVRAQVAQIGPRLTNIFAEAASQQRPTNAIADDLARALITPSSA